MFCDWLSALGSLARVREFATTSGGWNAKFHNFGYFYSKDVLRFLKNN